MSNDEYSVKGKSVDQLVADLERGDPQGTIGGGAYELIQAALQAASTKAQVRWSRVAALAACASVVVAIAALVAALSH